MANVTRRNFLQATAVAGGMVGLAGCNAGTGTTGSAADPLAAPAADKYPIDPDGDGVEAKWSSETSRKDKWTRVANPDGGAELGVMDTAKIIQVDGYAFRDMNGNGKLDLWEDWRQPAEERARALAESLSIEEIDGLMWHPTFGGTGTPGDDVLEDVDKGMRVALSRANAGESNYVDAINWVNTIQEACEKSSSGIPYMNSTDPYGTNGVPDPHCLAVAFDTDLWRRAGMFAGRYWRSMGYHIDLGPQVDVATNPIWARTSGTVCEDPATNRDFCRAYAGGLQSTWGDDDATDDKGWGKDSIAAMLKHYVASSCSEGGRDDHADAGKYDVFPGDNFEAHLIPFLDGGLHLDSKTGQMAAVMPNYGIAYSEDEAYGPNVAGAYNKRNLGILRNAGWDGMITTDWGVFLDGEKAWGMEDLTQPERFVKLMDATVDQVGNDFVPDDAMSAFELMKDEMGEEKATEKFRDSGRRILTVMGNLGLFDNPYNDREDAKEILDSEAMKSFAQEAKAKCVVMLKNAGNVISKDGISGKPKCYIPQKLSSGGGLSFFGGGTSTFSLAIDEDAANELFDVVTDTVGEPTGVAQSFGPDANQGESTEKVYQDSDCVRAGAEELADCQYAFLVLSAPRSSNDASASADADSTGYNPVSLQYRPYTATNAREVSIGGNIVDGVKENRSYKGKTCTCDSESDLDFVISVKESLPEGAKLVVAFEGATPMCFHEIEPYCDVILWSQSNTAPDFSSTYTDILAGKTEPTGLLACQMPKDMDAVEAQLEDVPRDMDCYTDSEGNTYDFCFGLNWSGVIDDERTKTYKAAPLTKPETEVIPG